MKVCIIATHWDIEIIMRSIYKSGADKVFLIVPKVEPATESVSQATLLAGKKIVSMLSGFTDVELVEASYIDYYDAFKTASSLMKQEKAKNNEIIVNISAGNKIMSTAMLMAAFLHRLKAYYSLPESYSSEYYNLDKSWRRGIKKIIEIPSLPINLDFSSKEKAFLKWLASRDAAAVSDYLDFIKMEDENKARASFHYYVKKLESQGVVSVDASSGKVLVAITPTGRIILEHIE